MTPEQEHKLELENTRLKKKLKTCIMWMKKEVQQSKEDAHMSEAEKNIQDIFGESIFKKLQEDTKQLWIESELHTIHCKKHNITDSTIVTILYQKIFEGDFEEQITNKWRKHYKKTNIQTPRSSISKILTNVIKKDYQLSYGKIVECLGIASVDEDIVRDFLDFLRNDYNYPIYKKHLSELNKILNSGTFTSKRHTGIVSIEQLAEVRLCFLGNPTNRSGFFIDLYTEKFGYTIGE